MCCNLCEKFVGNGREGLLYGKGERERGKGETHSVAGGQHSADFKLHLITKKKGGDGPLATSPLLCSKFTKK